MSILGIARRVRRLQVGGRFLLLALDHGLPAGPLPGIERPAELLRALASVSFSGVIANPGMVRVLAPALPRDTGLIVHLSASTLLGSSRASKVLVSSVERAVSLGADAVSVQISFGDRREDLMLSDAGRVVDEASSLGVPVLMMAYAPSPPGGSCSDSVSAAHAARAAAEIGASVVQTNYAGGPDGARKLVRGCPVPVILAGGPRTPSAAITLEGLPAMLNAGVAGLSVGRMVFQDPDPAGLAKRIAHIVFERPHPLVVEASR